MVPPEHTLSCSLDNVIERFSGPEGFDPITQLQLVTEETMAVHDRVQQLIEDGEVSGAAI
jgi:hypothetical protein